MENDRPLIGILSQVQSASLARYENSTILMTASICDHSSTDMLCLQPGSPAPKGSSYIAASYVKFVEVCDRALPC